jgi:hypothetical protein
MNIPPVIIALSPTYSIRIFTENDETSGKMALKRRGVCCSTLVAGSLCRLPAAGRGPFTRTGHGRLAACFESFYFTLAFAAAVFSLAAATAEGSAKAITASPCVKLPKPGSPPKP